MPSRDMSSKGTIRIHRIIPTSSKSNSKVDSIFHYRESTTVQYPMYITTRWKSNL